MTKERKENKGPVLRKFPKSLYGLGPKGNYTQVGDGVLIYNLYDGEPRFVYTIEDGVEHSYLVELGKITQTTITYRPEGERQHYLDLEKIQNNDISRKILITTNAAKDEIVSELRLRGVRKGTAEAFAEKAILLSTSSSSIPLFVKSDQLFFEKKIIPYIINLASIAFALYSENSEIPKFVDRNYTAMPTAESFLVYHYGSRLGLEGDLTLAGLKKIDLDLYEQLLEDCAAEPSKLNAWFPKPTERADAKLKQALGYVPTDKKERQNALSVLSRGGAPGSRGPYRRDPRRS